MFLCAGAGWLRATELDVARQRGRAHYENDDFKAAAVEFRRAADLAPASAADAFNLGLTLMRAEDYPDALAALRQAETLAPTLLAPRYVRGIIAKRQGEFAQAIACLGRVVDGDPACVGAHYNLAMCYKAAGQFTNAVSALQAALAREPANPGVHYQLITLYRRLGDVERAARHAEAFDRVKDTVAEAEKTAEALERSPYSVLLPTPSETPDGLPAAGGFPRFVEATREAGLWLPGLGSTEPTPLPRQFRAAEFNPEMARRYAAATGGGSRWGITTATGTRMSIWLLRGPGPTGCSGAMGTGGSRT